MFDWNDEEITDIIWGESDDHSVPYPDGSEGNALAYADNLKKECSVEGSNIKPTDRKKLATKSDLSNFKLEGSSKHDIGRSTITAGYRMESSADTTLANATKVNQDSLCESEKNQLHDDSRNFHNQNGDLEQGDFIDYGWSNIGSFDDLDKIFSNNDPIFGDTSLPNTHGLWSSCEEVRSSPEKSICSLSLSRSPSERLQVKAEYKLGQEKSSTGEVDMVNDITSNLVDARDHDEDTRMFLLGQKGNRDKTTSKGRPKLEQDGEHSQLQKLCKSSSPDLNKFGMPCVMNQPCLASGPSQQRQLEKLPHKYFAGPSTGNHYSSMPVWSQFHSGHVLSHYKASPGSSSDASSKPLMMTPQEKIDKLRRRQQLRAMLAIQRQQQQFTYQIAEEGRSVEDNLSRIAPLEQGDSNTVVEDTTLYLLQDVISKLDFQIRLCIRDSLFRLAQSATQRQCGNSSCSTQDSGREVRQEETKTLRPPNVETETNPIDRTVAHLLFHNSSDLTSKLAEIPRSSMLMVLNCERKAIGSLRFSQDNSETNTTTFNWAPGISTSRTEVDKMKSGPPENATNNEGAVDCVFITAS